MFRSVCPDDAQTAAFEVSSSAHPEWMPYLLLNHDDYVTLKVGMHWLKKTNELCSTCTDL